MGQSEAGDRAVLTAASAAESCSGGCIFALLRRFRAASARVSVIPLEGHTQTPAGHLVDIARADQGRVGLVGYASLEAIMATIERLRLASTSRSYE